MEDFSLGLGWATGVYHLNSPRPHVCITLCPFFSWHTATLAESVEEVDISIPDWVRSLNIVQRLAKERF